MITTQYETTKESTQFSITYPNGRMTFRFPETLESMTMSSLRKTFRMILESRWHERENDEVPQQVARYIDEWVVICKEALEYERKYNAEHYIDPESLIGSTTDVVQRRNFIRKNNKHMAAALGRIQKMVVRSEKVKQIWSELEAQYI